MSPDGKCHESKKHRNVASTALHGGPPGGNGRKHACKKYAHSDHKKGMFDVMTSYNVHLLLNVHHYVAQKQTSRPRSFVTSLRY